MKLVRDSARAGPLSPRPPLRLSLAAAKEASEPFAAFSRPEGRLVTYDDAFLAFADLAARHVSARMTWRELFAGEACLLVPAPVRERVELSVAAIEDAVHVAERGQEVLIAAYFITRIGRVKVRAVREIRLSSNAVHYVGGISQIPTS